MDRVVAFSLSKILLCCVSDIGFRYVHRQLFNVPVQVKAAFTRSYNKEKHKTPYAIRAAPKKGRKGGAAEDHQGIDEEGLEQEGEENSQEKDDIENDAMIKASKKPTKGGNARGRGGKGNKDAAKETTKGKGKGRGKNRN